MFLLIIASKYQIDWDSEKDIDDFFENKDDEFILEMINTLYKTIGIEIFDPSDEKNEEEFIKQYSKLAEENKEIMKKQTFEIWIHQKKLIFVEEKFSKEMFIKALKIGFQEQKKYISTWESNPRPLLHKNSTLPTELVEKML